ncbi:MAG: DinB family protein [Planctomycetota bacterium]
MIADPLATPREPARRVPARRRQTRRDARPAHARGLHLRPAAGGWTIHEILVHLVDVELTISVRVRKILAEERPPIPALDQDAWAARLHYQARAWRRALQLMRQLREGNIEILRHIAAGDWAREGIHPERGPTTLRQVIERAIEHLDRHVAQVRANLELLAGVRAP